MKKTTPSPVTRKRQRQTFEWCTIDLHIHTPASGDYQQPEVSYLDLLKRAEMRGLDIISFTDHNSVAGYAQMMEEIHQLKLLEQLNRILPEERSRLAEYQRLQGKILLLPGFEFTATFGFHILALFPPEKPLRELEYLLLSLNIPDEQLDQGSAAIGASTDVLTAYRMIDEAGGLVIAAHANSSNGVAMRGFPMGGQTKIAYTQDVHLHALEVTDLEQRSHGATAAFFNGTKPEYPRRMHCIQGSDAHRLTSDPQRKKNLGVGDRATDVNLPEVSFEALRELFLSNDFARTRPHRLQAEPAYDFVRTAREEGPNIVQSFHESAVERGGKLYEVLADVCAFANTNGGTLYIGLSADPRLPPVGLPKPEAVMAELEKEISNRIAPPLTVTLDVQETGGKKILRVLTPRGDDAPYVVDDYKVYVREEDKTELAVRDEIVGLVLRGQRLAAAQEMAAVITAPPVVRPQSAPQRPVEHLQPEAAQTEGEEPPHTGVEVVAVEEREGGRYFTMRDLRNGNVVKNVTRSSARRLWHYAIKEFSRLPVELDNEVQWQGDLGLLHGYQEGKLQRFDLVQRTAQGIRYYFGVTPDGIHGRWQALVGGEDE